MGVLRFRLPTHGDSARPADLRRAYVTGLDRTPGRLRVDLRDGLLIGARDVGESARLSVPWPVEGFGTPIVSTATLAERELPYDLDVELARGRLNEVRNQVADWRQMGLRTSAELEGLVRSAQAAFVRAATARDDPATASAASRDCLALAWRAGHLVAAEYTAQVLENRLAAAPKLPTLLAGTLDSTPTSGTLWASTWADCFNAAQVTCPWKALAPTEGKYRWDEFDAKLAWCRKRKVPAHAGPLVEFRGGALPDWIWLWEGDYDALLGMAVDLVRQAVGRSRGQVAVWHLVHRAASTGLLGLSEEEQVRLTAKLLQVARQADPAAQFVVDFDRPWAEWMGSSPYQLGPLHFADYLARADLGLAGVGLEIAPGYSAPGGHLRDTFDFSRLLDLYALLNLPLHVNFSLPSSPEPDPQSDSNISVDLAQWPAPPDESSQARTASEWIALAAAKPFVRSVTWSQMADDEPHVFPHAGLYRADKRAKPLASWLRKFRGDILE